jgi:hypothetical protein
MGKARAWGGGDTRAGWGCTRKVGPGDRGRMGDNALSQHVGITVPVRPWSVANNVCRPHKHAQGSSQIDCRGCIGRGELNGVGTEGGAVRAIPHTCPARGGYAPESGPPRPPAPDAATTPTGSRAVGGLAAPLAAAAAPAKGPTLGASHVTQTHCHTHTHVRLRKPNKKPHTSPRTHSTPPSNTHTRACTHQR